MQPGTVPEEVLDDAKKASEVNVMSWSDLFLLLGFGTTAILAWGWFDTHMFKTNSQTIIYLILTGCGAFALYLMHRRDPNLDNDLRSIEKASPTANLYVIRAIIVMMILGAGAVISIFVNALSCVVGFCIMK